LVMAIRLGPFLLFLLISCCDSRFFLQRWNDYKCDQERCNPMCEWVELWRHAFWSNDNGDTLPVKWFRGNGNNSELYNTLPSARNTDVSHGMNESDFAARDGSNWIGDGAIVLHPNVSFRSIVSHAVTYYWVTYPQSGGRFDWTTRSEEARANWTRCEQTTGYLSAGSWLASGSRSYYNPDGEALALTWFCPSGLSCCQWECCEVYNCELTILTSTIIFLDEYVPYGILFAFCILMLYRFYVNCLPKIAIVDTFFAKLFSIPELTYNTLSSSVSLLLKSPALGESKKRQEESTTDDESAINSEYSMLTDDESQREPDSD
ncbi:hypothetical protein PFISCL1PPCAC_11128, partial [Pristionchus fissidentatus]